MNSALRTRQKNVLFAQLILDELGRQMPFLLRATTDSMPPLADRKTVLESIALRLVRLYGEPAEWLEKTVRGYVMLSVEFLKLQRELEKNGRYLLGSEREALQAAYDNANVFGDYYLPGLLLSEALWPNHFSLNRAFHDYFVKRLGEGAKVLEIGVGSGYHLDELLSSASGVQYTGLDISEYAIDFARHYAFGPHGDHPSVTFIKGNVSDGIPLPAASVDGLIMGEILEHIDDPAMVLRQARSLLKPDGFAFITTVVFAANIDHIFMYEKVDDIRAMLEVTGWQIIKDWPLPIYPTDEPKMVKRPMNYGALIMPTKAS